MPDSMSGSCHTATCDVFRPFTYCHRLVTWRKDTAVPKLKMKPAHNAARNSGDRNSDIG